MGFLISKGSMDDGTWFVFRELKDDTFLEIRCEIKNGEIIFEQWRLTVEEKERLLSLYLITKD